MSIFRDYKESQLNALNQSVPKSLRDLGATTPVDNIANSISREFIARKNDVERLGKFFKSPKGIVFSAKQGALLQTTKEGGLGKTALNVGKLVGITLAQAAVSGTGIYFINGLFHGSQYLNPLDRGQDLKLSLVPKVPLNLSVEGIETLHLYKYAVDIDNRPDSLKYKIGQDEDRKIANKGTYIGLSTDDLARESNGELRTDVITKVEGDASNRKPGSLLQRTEPFEKLIKRDSKLEAPDIIRTKLAPKRGFAGLGQTDRRRRGTELGFEDEVDELISSEVIDTPEYREKDIIPFEFQILNPGQPSTPRFVYFRAYLDSFNDNYNGTWNSTKYIGRGEPLYNYDGFDRNIDFSFKVAAGTRAELLPLYKKLNYLVSTTAPSYDEDQTFMRGVIARVSIGDYLMQTPGFFSTISLSWDKAYSWETGTLKETRTAGASYSFDDKLPRVPHILDINMSFTPIHNFNPALASPFIMDTNFNESQYTPNFTPVFETTNNTLGRTTPAEASLINPSTPTRELSRADFTGERPSTSQVTPSFPISREEQELEAAFSAARVPGF